MLLPQGRLTFAGSSVHTVLSCLIAVMRRGLRSQELKELMAWVELSPPNQWFGSLLWAIAGNCRVNQGIDFLLSLPGSLSIKDRKKQRKGKERKKGK